MALVEDGVLHRREIPHEPGQWIDFRELDWTQLGAAQKVRQAEAMRNVMEIGSNVVKAYRDAFVDGAGDDKPADPANGYDQALMLRMGVAAWSYPAEVNEQTVKRLDARTAAWAFRELVAIHHPPEAEVGNAAAPSTEH